MLYETQVEYVPADKEIRIIKDYIELERLRYDQTFSVTFVITGACDNLKIPPLLMMPLVENAFKHGISETIDNPFINIRLLIDNSTIRFVVENSMDCNGSILPGKESIGIYNLRRQLELLFSDYELKFENNGNIFCASMFINIASYAKN